jgi:hypothetical protein
MENSGFGSTAAERGGADFQRAGAVLYSSSTPASTRREPFHAALLRADVFAACLLYMESSCP